MIVVTNATVVGFAALGMALFLACFAVLTLNALRMDKLYRDSHKRLPLSED